MARLATQPWKLPNSCDILTNFTWIYFIYFAQGEHPLHFMIYALDSGEFEA